MIKFYERISFKLSLALCVALIPMLVLVASHIVDAETDAAERAMVEKAQTAALAGARAYAQILEEGLAARAFTVENLIDPRYVPISYPVAIEHPRFHTAYDAYTDAHGVQALQDAILDSSPDFIYSSGIDHLGYVPTPHRAYDHEPTGDFELDRRQSRAKRKYESTLHSSAANFHALATQPTLVQPYLRDTGDPAIDVAAPITVRGHHFGAFRVGVRRDRIDAARDASVGRLGRSFSVLTLALMLFVFVVTYVALRPLDRLARAATVLSEGDGFNLPVSSTRRDEVGVVARAVDGLRLSVRALARRAGVEV